MGAEYLSYVKSIATFAPTFYGYIISVLASVCNQDSLRIPVAKNRWHWNYSRILLEIPLRFPDVKVRQRNNDCLLRKKSYKYGVR